MKVRRERNYRSLLLPVVLVLAAAFLAAGLGGFAGNDISGAQVRAMPYNSLRSCEWFEDYDSNPHVEKLCPKNKPVIVSGGCWTMGNDNILLASYPRPYNPQNITEGKWVCISNKAVVTKIATFCCPY